MALWKETAQNEQRAMPNEQKAAVQSEPVEKVEAAPAPMPPVAPRKGKCAERSLRIRSRVRG